MTTMKIPEDQKADRADFKIKDKDGEEKKISLRIGEIENRIPESQNIKLTIKGIPDVIHRGFLIFRNFHCSHKVAISICFKTTNFF